MTKSELIAEIAARANLTQVVANTVIDSAISVISERLAQGQDVPLPGLGTFKRVKRAARTANNLRTGEAIAVPEKFAVAFSMAKAIKQRLNEG